MATKTSFNQRFHKNGIFYQKGILKANYLLPARQNMNNFKHILHNIHLQHKHKICLIYMAIAKNGLTLKQRNITKNEVCPRKNMKLTLFRLAFVIQVLLIALTTRSVWRPT